METLVEGFIKNITKGIAILKYLLALKKGFYPCNTILEMGSKTLFKKIENCFKICTFLM